MAFRNGGYFPTEWGWSALALLWIAAIALFVRERLAIGRLEWAMLASLAGFVAWIGLSVLWSTSVERSVLEAQRGIVYLAGLLAVFVVARGRSVVELLAAAWCAAAVVATYALVRLFFPEHFELPSGLLYPLSEPLGYPNALALLAAIGGLLAVAFAAHGRSRATRASASACVVLFVLTIFFTFSHGAWGALAAGLVAMLLLDSRRFALLRTLAGVAPAAAVAVWLGSRAQAHALTPGGTAGEAIHEAHVLALETALLCAAAATAPLAVSAAARRVAPSRRAFVVAVLVGFVAVSSAAAEHYGARPGFGGTAIVRTRHPALAQATTSVRLSLSGRRLLWRQAWNDWKAHPVLGSGAGTFEPYWVRHRQTPGFVRDAHSLYLETLAELGPVGLALLLAVLILPLVAAARARRHPFVPGAFAAYLAYLVHAGVDWDWEMPAVTLLGLFCGGAVLLAARGVERPIAGRFRAAALAVTLALVAFSFVGLIGNGALAASARAADAGRWSQSASDARKATRWLPWSSEAWWRLGVAQSEEDDTEVARSSLRKATSKGPDEWRPWVSLIRLSTGRAQRRALREAARLNPRDPEVVQFLLAPGSLTQRWSYDDSWIGWPVAPVHRQHPIRSSFLDPRAGTLRTGGETAYHFGIDVGVRDDRPEPGAPPGRAHKVYAVEGGTAILPERWTRGPCVNRKVSVGHFDYWHVDASGVVTDGERIRPGQLIGWTCKGLWHVHLAEWMQLFGRRVYVNPIHPGMKLGPYADSEPLRIHAIAFYRPAMPSWTAAVRVAFPAAGARLPRTRTGRARLSGLVDVRAWIDDPPPYRNPLASPTPPNAVRLEIVRESDGRRVLTRTVFRAALFLGDSHATQVVPIDYHYAPGTKAALPGVLCARARWRDCGGVYWFRLFAEPTGAYWNTATEPNGDYRLVVSASDAAGNATSAEARVTIDNP